MERWLEHGANWETGGSGTSTQSAALFYTELHRWMKQWVNKWTHYIQRMFIQISSLCTGLAADLKSLHYYYHKTLLKFWCFGLIGLSSLGNLSWISTLYTRGTSWFLLEVHPMLQLLCQAVCLEVPTPFWQTGPSPFRSSLPQIYFHNKLKFLWLGKAAVFMSKKQSPRGMTKDYSQITTTGILSIILHQTLLSLIRMITPWGKTLA